MNYLVPEDSDILRTRCDEWDFSSQSDPDALVEQMISVMREERGMGLSANQIGLNHRVFVMEYGDQVWACFNPEIVSSSEELAIFEEGCLSFPDLILKIKRPAEVTVKYQNQRGDFCEEELTGLVARCYQHELDHLNGICFTDVASKLTLKMATKRRAKNRRNR